MCRNSFVLYTDQKETIDELSDEEAGKIFKALYEYNKTEQINLTGVLKAIFMQFKVFLDKDNAKWVEEKKKRMEAGRLGGIQRAINNNQALSSKSKQCLDMLNNAKQSQADQADNVNVNVNVNNNVNVICDDIYTYAQQQFGRMLNGAEIELMQTWEDNELTRYAIKQTVLARKNSLKYTQAILNSYKTKGITNVLDAEKEKEEFEKKKQEPVKRDKEIVPEWFNKDYSEKNERKLSDEDYEWIRKIKEADRIEKANKDNNV